MSEMIELADKDLKTAVLNILYMKVGKLSVMRKIVYVTGCEGQMVSVNYSTWPL